MLRIWSRAAVAVWVLVVPICVAFAQEAGGLAQGIVIVGHRDSTNFGSFGDTGGVVSRMYTGRITPSTSADAIPARDTAPPASSNNSDPDKNQSCERQLPTQVNLFFKALNWNLEISRYAQPLPAPYASPFRPCAICSMPGRALLQCRGGTETSFATCLKLGCRVV
jgi:hypothetical protein